MTTESTEDWKYWYKKMTNEERRQYNKDKYLTYRDKSTLRCAKWKEENSFKNNLYQRVYHAKKKYPIAFVPESPTHEELLAWAEERHGQPCQYCGRPSTSMDHKIALSRGGTHTLDNLQLICPTCNLSKNAMSEEEFQAWISDLVGRYLELRTNLAV